MWFSSVATLTGRGSIGMLSFGTVATVAEPEDAEVVAGEGCGGVVVEMEGAGIEAVGVSFGAT